MEIILKEEGKPERIVSTNMFTKQLEQEFATYCTSSIGRGKTFDEYLKEHGGYYIVDTSPIPVVDLDKVRKVALEKYREEVRMHDQERPGFAEMMQSLTGIELGKD